ncbi:MAG: hypothetical protein ACRD4O_10100 [Bryobacteraceae bacterium]
MKASKHSVVLTAALTGLLGGMMSRLNATPVSGHSGTTLAAHGQMSSTTQNATQKHSCKGKNSCKGQGGCKSSDNGCKGKNSCKGKGGCATDISKSQMKKMMKRMHTKNSQSTSAQPQS